MASYLLKLKNNEKGKTHIKVRVYYTKGGLSYYNYKNYPQGLYCSFTPIKREVNNNFVIEGSSMGEGFSIPLEAWKRDNAKKTIAKAKEIHGNIIAKTGEVWEKLNAYLQEQGLELE